MKKILLIEDEEMLADLYQERFSNEGFEVVVAYDGETGFELAKKEKPDMIILDILLPKENGISFLKKLREESEISSTPVIAFSNFDDPATKKEAFNLGIKDYLLKANFTPDQLVTKIKEYLPR